MTCERHCFTGFTEAVVIDTETTGLDSDNDRIVSVSGLCIDLQKAAEEKRLDARTFNAHINPGIPIPEAARRVHGISDADVADEEGFADIAQGLRDFIGRRPLIGHNIQFDKRFLNAELKRAGHRMLTKNRGYCTQARFKEHMDTLYDERKRFWKLDDMLEELGIEGRATGVHEASEDAFLTAQAAILFYSLDNGFIDGPRRQRTTAPAPASSPVTSSPPPHKPTPQQEATEPLKDATSWSQVEPLKAHGTDRPVQTASSEKKRRLPRFLIAAAILIALVVLLTAYPDSSSTPN